MSHAIKTDPVLEAMIEAEVAEALRPHEGIFPPEVMDEMRHMMRIVMRTHPTATHLLEQFRPRVAPDESSKEDVRIFQGVRAKKAKGE